jgi:raffinose/stachyose/melibiose transport system permease protein/N-acetylglucosamine transport system permease protein
MKEKIREKKPTATSFKIVKIIVLIIFVLHAVSLIAPIAWGIVVSLTSTDFFMLNGFMKAPDILDFSNYIKAFVSIEAGGFTFSGMFINSVWWAIGGAFLGVAVSAATAYAVARYKFAGGPIIYWTAIISMMIPIMSNLTALFKLSNLLRIYNTPLMLITQMSGTGFNFIVLYSFFKGISGEYAEAAFIDGAGHFRVFLTIYSPLAVPSMIALGLTTFIGLWGDPQFPLLFMPEYPTLASGLYTYQTAIEREPGATPILYASLIITTIPVLVLFVIFRDKFMDVQISGGIKG